MFAGMLGGVGLRLAIIAAIAVAVGGFYLHYQNIVNERNEALQQVGALEVANKAQATTIERLVENTAEWARSAEAFQETLDELANNQTRANEQTKRLNDVLSRHDLTALSLAKPGLIQRRINSGTSDILRLFESETSGSKNRSDRSGTPSGETPGP